MGVNLQPRVGDWYQTAEGLCFEVVAYDIGDDTVEIQYFDGSVEELDMEAWLELPLAPAEPPDDWSGPMDLMREDFLTDEIPVRALDGRNVLDELDNLR